MNTFIIMWTSCIETTFMYLIECGLLQWMLWNYLVILRFTKLLAIYCWHLTKKIIIKWVVYLWHCLNRYTVYELQRTIVVMFVKNSVNKKKNMQKWSTVALLLYSYNRAHKRWSTKRQNSKVKTFLFSKVNPGDVSLT